MIRQATSDLTEEAQKVLDDLQQKIDNIKDFADKVSKAQSLWESKTSSKAKEQAFAEIKEKLEKLCVSIEVCNYCEHNEGNDIEHIYPKSFFPHRTFVWLNYLLACKQCNSGLKLDKFYIINALDKPELLPRGNAPINDDGAFINPRIDDPLKFMLLNLETFQFEYGPEIFPKQTAKDYHKADKTIEILELNTREQLIGSRKNSANFYYERLDRLVKIINAQSNEEVRELLTPNEDRIDTSGSLISLKNYLKDCYKNDILKHHNPSVWYAIVTFASNSGKWVKLFEALPEAKGWLHEAYL